MQKFWRWMTYFFRGHNRWLIFPAWVMNFIVIQYELFFKQTDLFGNIFVFAVAFLLLWIPIATFIGRWDYNKGSYGVEQTIILSNNPEWQKLNRKLDDITEMIKNE